MSIYPKLFIPGPTHVPESIMNILSTPQIGHRTEEISELIESIIVDIKDLLYTTNNIYLVSHAATGLWEMGLKNSVQKGVLHCVNGAFSSKWVKVSESCGYNHNVINYEWGKGVKADDIDKMLSTGNYDAENVSYGLRTLEQLRCKRRVMRKVQTARLNWQQTHHAVKTPGT